MRKIQRLALGCTFTGSSEVGLLQQVRLGILMYGEVGSETQRHTHSQGKAERICGALMTGVVGQP